MNLMDGLFFIDSVEEFKVKSVAVWIDSSCFAKSDFHYGKSLLGFNETFLVSTETRRMSKKT
jgi:hypothetical protein